MKPIITPIDFEEFKKETERRKAVFALSTYPDDAAREAINRNFDELITICQQRIETEAVAIEKLILNSK